MYLKSLELINFRNYSRQIIEPGKFLNHITGPNAQGKTNILEAVYMSCTGKSFRTTKEREIIYWDSQFSQLHCLFETDMREIEVKILLRPGKKKIEVNGVLAHGYPLEWPGVVLFTPDDLALVKGSPHERRRFLDLEIGPFHPQYGHFLGRYNRVLSQRNNLLKEIRERKEEKDSLQPWNEQLCRYGSRLLAIRLELLKKLRPNIGRVHRDLTGGSENIDIRYLSSLKLEATSTEEQIYELFTEELHRVEKEEITRSQSVVGPHRDDLSIYINGNDARIYGSQGQQRTVVLTLKISQLQQWYNEFKEYPLLLLDDVLFELDHSRRQALYSRIRGTVQTFVTSTGEESIDLGGNYVKKTYTVNMGKIINQ